MLKTLHTATYLLNETSLENWVIIHENILFHSYFQMTAN